MSLITKDYAYERDQLSKDTGATLSGDDDNKDRAMQIWSKWQPPEDLNANDQLTYLQDIGIVSRDNPPARIVDIPDRAEYDHSDQVKAWEERGEIISAMAGNYCWEHLAPKWQLAAKQWYKTTPDSDSLPYSLQSLARYGDVPRSVENLLWLHGMLKH